MHSIRFNFGPRDPFSLKSFGSFPRFSIFLLLISALFFLQSCSGGGATSSPSPQTPPPPQAPPPQTPPSPPTIQFTAAPTSIVAGASSTLAWTTSNTTSVSLDNGIGAQPTAGSISVHPSQTTTYTLTALGSGSTQATAAATVTVTAPPAPPPPPPPPATANIPTWHVDNARTGLNPTETLLTPATVSSANFARLFTAPVDGYIYAEPLYLSAQNIDGVTRNVVFIATEYDSIYAFDADTFTPDANGNDTPLWHTALLNPGETPLPVAPSAGIAPWIGITSTPVIDPATHTLYAVATYSGGNGRGHRLYALDTSTGALKFGAPTDITACVNSTAPDAVNGQICVNPGDLSRASLLLANNTIYIGFGAQKHGWILSYDATSLQQKQIFNLSPNADGTGDYAGAGGIWGAGGGPAADSSGDLFVITSDGPFGLFNGEQSWGDSILHLDPNLNVLDSFTASDQAYLNCKDLDIGSATALLLQDSSGSYLLTGGKSGKSYLLDRAHLGGYHPGDSGALQTYWFSPALAHTGTCTDSNNNLLTGMNDNPAAIFATPAAFNGFLYSAAQSAPLKQFRISGGAITDTGNHSPETWGANSFGATAFVSANNSSSGIVWVLDNEAPIQNPGQLPPAHAILRAYDAANVSTELYNSAANPDDAGPLGLKFTSPIVANGKVFVVGAHDPLNGDPAQKPQGELAIYGLKP